MNEIGCWRTIGVFGGDRSCGELVTHIHCRSCPLFMAAGRALLDRKRPATAATESTSHVARAVTASAPTIALLVFRVGDALLALPLRTLIEVVELRAIRKVPHRSSRGLAGIVNIRGQLTLCASLQALLELPEAEVASSARRMVHFSSHGGQWTFVVDEVCGIADVVLTAILAPPSSVSLARDACSSGSFDRDGRAVTLLDVERLAAALRREVG